MRFSTIMEGTEVPDRAVALLCSPSSVTREHLDDLITIFHQSNRCARWINWISLIFTSLLTLLPIFGVGSYLSTISKAVQGIQSRIHFCIDVKIPISVALYLSAAMSKAQM